MVDFVNILLMILYYGFSNVTFGEIWLEKGRRKYLSLLPITGLEGRELPNRSVGLLDRI